MPSELKQIRQSLRLSAREVAEAVGVHPNQIYRWEAGTSSPSGRHLVRLAALYGRDPSQLIGADLAGVDGARGGR